MKLDRSSIEAQLVMNKQDYYYLAKLNFVNSCQDESIDVVKISMIKFYKNTDVLEIDVKYKNLFQNT